MTDLGCGLRWGFPILFLLIGLGHLVWVAANVMGRR